MDYNQIAGYGLVLGGMIANRLRFEQEIEDKKRNKEMEELRDEIKTLKKNRRKMVLSPRRRSHKTT